MGVPFDLVQRAARQGGQAMTDLEDLARINANRLLQFGGAAGEILTAVAATLLSVLGLLGFIYGVELCQALFLLALPFSHLFATPKMSFLILSLRVFSLMRCSP